jgi:hypothetical protein
MKRIVVVEITFPIADVCISFDRSVVGKVVDSIDEVMFSHAAR